MSRRRVKLSELRVGDRISEPTSSMNGHIVTEVPKEWIPGRVVLMLSNGSQCVFDGWHRHLYIETARS